MGAASVRHARRHADITFMAGPSDSYQVAMSLLMRTQGLALIAFIYTSASGRPLQMKPAVEDRGDKLERGIHAWSPPQSALDTLELDDAAGSPSTKRGSEDSSAGEC